VASDCKTFKDKLCPYSNEADVITDLVHKSMIVLSLLVASIPEGLVLSVVLSNANFLSSLTRSQIHIRNIQTSQSLPKITHHIISCKKLDQNLISSLNTFTEQISVIIIVEDSPSHLLPQSDLQEI
jgi:hypothetical protein